MRRRATRALAGVVVAASAACSTIPGNKALPPAAAVAGARPGGVLRVAIDRPASVDPGTAHNPSARLIAAAMCDTLVVLDPVTGELRPGIAKKWTIATENGGTNILVALREDVYFSDGSKVNARAVVDTLSRLAFRDYASPLASLLSPVGGFASLNGQRPGGATVAGRPFLGGLRVTSPYGLEIQLETTDHDFIRTLAHPATAPLSSRALSADPVAFERRPVCAGPYQLDQPVQPTDKTIRLTRSKRHTPVVAALTRSGAGYADAIDFTVYDSPQQQLEALERGEVDVTTVPLELRERAGKAGALSESPHTFVQYIGAPAGGEGPTAKREVRQALSMALDREAIAREVYGGGRVPATGFLPRALGLQYDAEVCGDLVPTTARVAEAREVLKRADVKLEGEKLPLYYSTGFGNDRLAAAAAQQWRAAFGVDVQPTALTPQAWLARATSVTSFDGPFTQGWDVQVASASRYFEVFTAGASGAGNLTGFASPTFERFLSDVRGAGDPGSISSDDEERRIAFRRAEERLCDDMPLIPVAYAQAHAVTRPSVAPARESGFLDVRGRLMLRELYVTSPS